MTLIANAIAAHGGDSWYAALVREARLQARSDADAVALADAIFEAAPTANFNPDQLRDHTGRFSSGGGTSAPGRATTIDVERKGAGGVTKASRVGVPGDEVPPPPAIPRLPNLTRRERAVEDKFVKLVNENPDKAASTFREQVMKRTPPGGAPTFGTDDAKEMTDAWTHSDPEVRAGNRATLNLALHQAANAVAKRAFLQHLDGLQKGDEVMVTVGGCGAGKGYALGNVPKALEMKGRAKAVWDSAGDQNATENPWIQREAEKRGLKVNYAFVHADPETQWAHPERGVVKRASDPKDGRMVDADVFADSYAIGARNHQAFYEKNKDNPSASFVFLKNTGGKPEELPGIPKEALSIDRGKLAKFARDVVRSSGAPLRVRSGGSAGERIWGG